MTKTNCNDELMQKNASRSTLSQTFNRIIIVLFLLFGCLNFSFSQNEEDPFCKKCMVNAHRYIVFKCNAKTNLRPNLLGPFLLFKWSENVDEQYYELDVLVNEDIYTLDYENLYRAKFIYEDGDSFEMISKEIDIFPNAISFNFDKKGLFDFYNKFTKENNYYLQSIEFYDSNNILIGIGELDSRNSAIFSLSIYCMITN